MCKRAFWSLLYAPNTPCAKLVESQLQELAGMQRHQKHSSENKISLYTEVNYGVFTKFMLVCT